VPPGPVCVAVVGPGDEATPADGATSAGGLAVGVLPGSDRTGGHPHSSVLLATGLGELRNGVLVCSADAVIAVGGSWGHAERGGAGHAHRGPGDRRGRMGRA
jgi:uncharacterized protein (TIGR00725 family)